jgi:glycosyltransferase involved in cell wall biosynthesis
MCLTVVAPPLPNVQRELAEVGAGFVGLPASEGALLRWAFVRWLWHKRRVIRRQRALVVLNGRGAAYLAPIVRLYCGGAPIIISHTELSMRPGDHKETLYGIAARFARCVIAVSDSVTMQHRQRWPALAVESIPNWIELQPKNTLGSVGRLSSKAGRVSAAVVSRLACRKGVEDVVAACIDDGDVELHLYGDGPNREEFRNKAKEFTWLHLHGHVDDLPQRLPAHSILISGSYSESFSYSVAEAIHAGLLCVVTDIPAHRELLGADYPSCLYFPPGDVVALRQALLAARELLSRDAGEGARVAVSMALVRITTRNSPEAAKPRYLTVFSATDSQDCKM